MSILRYEIPRVQCPDEPTTEEALLRLLLIIGGVLLALLLLGCTLLRSSIEADAKLWGTCCVAIGGSALAVLRWVLRPLWRRRYEGSAGVWGVLLLGLLLPLGLAALGWLLCSVPTTDWTG